MQTGTLLVSIDLPDKLKYGTGCTYTVDEAVCGTEGEQSGGKENVILSNYVCVLCLPEWFMLPSSLKAQGMLIIHMFGLRLFLSLSQ